MGLSSRFTIRKEASPALLDLLEKTVLGTNGACYRHLDTRSRILEADNPLFVSLERDGKVQGNIICLLDSATFPAHSKTCVSPVPSFVKP